MSTPWMVVVVICAAAFTAVILLGGHIYIWEPIAWAWVAVSYAVRLWWAER